MKDSLQLEQITVGPIGTNCYLLFNRDSGELFLVDPGDEPQRIEQKISAMGGRPTAILLTHGHSDHIMAVEALKKDFPDALIYAAEEDRCMLSSESPLNSGFETRPFHVTVDRTVKDGMEMKAAGVRIRVMATPGHTEGSVCYYLPDEGILFSGDTLFQESYGRTDLATGSDTDMMSSLHKILTALPDEIRVLPGHMGETTIGHEKKYNPGAP